MTIKTFNLPATFFPMLLLFFAVCCGRPSAFKEKLDVADSLLESRPDSSLEILNVIPVKELHGDEGSST